MSKSLAELRSAPKPKPEERTVTVCLAPDLVAEMQSLSEELDSLVRAGSDGEQAGPPKRVADARHAQSRRITERMQELIGEMADHEGELRVARTRTDGEWRRWVNEHPARAEGEPGYERDIRWVGGFCNADDLIDDLGAYVTSWEGEALEPNDWVAAIEPRVSPPDKAQAASEVVAMYEVRTDFRQWRNGLSANLKRFNGSASPAASESPTSDSMAGSPALFDEATTAQASK